MDNINEENINEENTINNDQVATDNETNTIAEPDNVIDTPIEEVNQVESQQAQDVVEEEIDIPFDSNNNISYNSNFKCTYQIMDDLDDSNNLYRIQFLQAFNTYRWDSNIIDNTIQKIYSQLKNSKYGRNILNAVNLNVTITNFINNSDIYILFSYDYFYIFHDCLCDLINNGLITDDNYNYLIKQITNK